MSATLRCWARRVADGALCERVSEPGMVHIHIGNRPGANVDVTWIDEYCAPDAGPDGRETAALRLWEVSTQLDLVAFMEGGMEEWAPFMRRVASTLWRGGFVGGDLFDVEVHLAGARSDVAHPSVLEDVRRRHAGIESALTLAADILRPWAEGSR